MNYILKVNFDQNNICLILAIYIFIKGSLFIIQLFVDHKWLLFLLEISNLHS